MFLCFVLTGNQVKLQNQDRSLRLPPLLPGDQSKRYDSVLNNDGTHTIVYANQRQYPAFLIRYRIE